MIPTLQKAGFAWWLMVGLCLVLAGCSSIGDEAADPASQAAPDPARPDVAKAILVIKTTATQYHLAAPLEIAGPIEAPIGSINPWVICLRSAAERRFTVALFYKADTLASSHISTLGDNCDSQTYRPVPN